jgi:hypothetical protein
VGATRRALKIGDAVTDDPVPDDIIHAIDLGQHSAGWRAARPFNHRNVSGRRMFPIADPRRPIAVSRHRLQNFKAARRKMLI